MDTRQLAAFCAVVERRSFSQAAARLGVTQPAVSLQIRALEERLGQRLLDRSGRRVEPTEAGMLLYRGAQKLLALEEQLVEEVSAGAEGALTGRLEIGASTGPGGSVLPPLLCEFQAANPGTTIGLSVFDTQTVVELVGRRELELGVVGAARRQRAVVFEPFFTDEVVLAVPLGRRGGSRGGDDRGGARRGPRAGAGDLARSCGWPVADAACRRVRRLRARAARVIVRWGLDDLPALLAELGIDYPFLVASE